MANQYLEFKEQVEAVVDRFEQGEISAEERDQTIRQMKLKESRWGDIWMLSPQGQWYRKATGSSQWMPDYPVALVDPAARPPIPDMDMPQIARAVHDCTRCPLHQERKRAVPGEGNPNADIMLIGEGPGFYEDKQARPFVGKSGNFLAQLLNDIGYKRQDVFITNVVKCRPPGNRDPQPEELDACRPYLERQIELIDPKVIVTLGRFSMYRYFPGASISKIHGQPKEVDGRLIMPMFHPAAALRNPQWRAAIEADFQKLSGLVGEVTSRLSDQTAADTDDAADAEQLSLF